MARSLEIVTVNKLMVEKVSLFHCICYVMENRCLHTFEN